MKLESKIQSEIIKWLKKRPNSYTYKHEPTPSGIPDIHHMENGIHYWFEVKRTAKEQPSPIQLYRHKQLREAGDNVHVVYILQQVKDIIKH